MSTPARPKKQRPALSLAPLKLDDDKPEASVTTVKDRILEDANEVIKDPKFLEAVNGMLASKVKVGDRISDLNAARKIVMAYELYKEFPDLKFESKPDGVSVGFIASNAEHRFYVKNFLGRSTSGKPDIAELFAYKFLQEAGFGAQIDGYNYRGILPFIVSHDLLKDGGQLLFGDAAVKYLSTHKQSDEECKSRVIALEILGKIFNLGDASDNPGNYGIVKIGGQVSPILVDFHFDPKLSTTISRRGTNIKLPGLDVALASAESAQDLVSVGLTRAFAGAKIAEDTYAASLSLISREAFEEAIANSRNYCEKFLVGISDEELKESGFDAKSLDEYIDEIRGNISKLQERRKSSSAAVAVGEYFSRGSQSALQVSGRS